MKKRYSKTRNNYFIKLLDGAPWVYERDEPTVAEKVKMASVLTMVAAMCEHTMYFRLS